MPGCRLSLVIGRRWPATGPDGTPRRGRDDDLAHSQVRLLIEARQVVFPMLVECARLPNPRNCQKTRVHSRDGPSAMLITTELPLAISHGPPVVANRQPSQIAAAQQNRYAFQLRLRRKWRSRHVVASLPFFPSVYFTHRRFYAINQWLTKHVIQRARINRQTCLDKTKLAIYVITIFPVIQIQPH